LLIDVDLFKQYNDLYGHQCGDGVLQRIAGCTAKTVNRSGDLVARYGGEEFVVLLPSTNASSALLIAEQIRLAVEELAIRTSGASAARVTISVGAASVQPTGATEPAELVRAADAALYSAKNGGRNKTVLSDIPTHCA
jgi:diguanylate cyclase (GGDEF)-like protein